MGRNLNLELPRLNGKGEVWAEAFKKKMLVEKKIRDCKVKITRLKWETIVRAQYGIHDSYGIVELDRNEVEMAMKCMTIR